MEALQKCLLFPVSFRGSTEAKQSDGDENPVPYLSIFCTPAHRVDTVNQRAIKQKTFSVEWASKKGQRKELRPPVTVTPHEAPQYGSDVTVKCFLLSVGETQRRGGGASTI